MTWGGGRPHPVGDNGQRYEVSFIDGDGKRRVMGWTNTWEQARAFTRSIELHPVWNTPEIKDRHEGCGDGD